MPMSIAGNAATSWSVNSATYWMVGFSVSNMLWQLPLIQIIFSSGRVTVILSESMINPIYCILVWGMNTDLSGCIKDSVFLYDVLDISLTFCLA